MTTLNELAEMKRAFEEKMKVDGKAVISSEMRGLFEKFPTISRVGFPCYAPHFNDGDACVWSMHEPRVEFTDEVGLNYLGDYEGFEEETQAIGDLYDRFTAVEDIFEILCDDGIVLFLRDGSVAIEEYRHD